MRRSSTNITAILIASGLLAATASTAQAAVNVTTRSDSFLTVDGNIILEDRDPAPGSAVAGQTTTSLFTSPSDYTLNAYGQAGTDTRITARASATSRVGPNGALGPVQADGGAETLLNYVNTSGSKVRAYLDFSVNQIDISAANAQPGLNGDVFAAVYGYAFVDVNGVARPGAANLFTYSVTDTGPSYLYGADFNAALTGLVDNVSCAGFNCSNASYLTKAAVAGTLDLGELDLGDSLTVDYILNARAISDMVAYTLPNGVVAYGSANAQTDDYCGAACGFHFARLRFETIDPVSGVPEPATWAMMIGGFGLVGARMRRRARTGLALA